jgi:mono/diheme cytochrome c family protein
MTVSRVVGGLAIGVTLLAVHPGATGAPEQAPAAATTVEGQRAFVQQYCVGCHNDRTKSGGFSWSELDVARPGHNAARAEDVIRKVRAGLMPPAGARRPEAALLTEFAASLGTRLDEMAAAHPVYKAPELHRLNRREYRSAVRDVLGLDVEVSALLPPDARTGAFDNMADALTITPALMQAYIRAADKVSRLAIGDPNAPPVMAKYDVPKVVNQMRHVEGAPFGTRGGTAVVHHFPADGTYTFQSELYFYYLGELIGGNLPESLQGQELEISVDGRRVHAFTIDPLYEGNTGPLVTPPVPITAGPHRVAATFVAKADGALEDSVRLVEQTILDVSVGLHPGMTTLPHLQTLTVVGPMQASGVSDTPSRRHIFSCTPNTAADEPPCATEIVTALARRAFRRPPTAEDIDGLMQMYALGREQGRFDDGIRTAAQSALARPEFIFRFERVPEGIAAGEHYRLHDLELASRLSYFLWGAGPDETLIAAAAQGQLRTAAGLERQVGRMLADRRAGSLATHFAAQWLRLTGLAEVHPEPTIFPDFTRNLAQSMRREVELLFDGIVREDRSIVELLTADYTYVNETLARHYGIPNVAGPQFRKVTLTDPNRFGLTGRGAILTMTSLANRTSPVARGKYVLEVLLGAPPPLPPANVPPLAETVNNQRVRTVRERIEDHRKNPTCAGCHKIMDPIGLALENFDAIGRWRANDGGMAVDPRGEMYDGRALDGPVSLRAALLGHTDAFRAGFSESLLSYALGRILDTTDMPTARAVARQGARDKDRFSAYVMAIVTSGPFQMRTLAPDTETAAAKGAR